MLSPLFGIVLVLLSVILIQAHIRDWRVERRQLSEDWRSAEYARMRVRRRVQASGLIGVLGLLIACFPLVPTTYLAVTIYLLVLVLLVFWLMLLAVGDLYATRVHYRRVRDKHWEAESRFASQLGAATHIQDADDAADPQAPSPNP